MITHFSHSSTTTFKRCLYRFHEYYGGEKREDGPRNFSQRLGHAGHVALAAYYSGKPIQDSIDIGYEDYNPTTAEEVMTYKELEGTLLNYFSLAARDGWTVISVEKEVKIGKLMGVMDLVIETKDGSRYIVDHKFQKSTKTDHLEVDDQVSFYLLLALHLGLNVNGFLLNIIPTGSEKLSPVRRMVTRSQGFLSRYAKEMGMTIELIERYLSAPTPIRNYTSSCKWDCDLYKLCLQRMNQGL